jgi:hypothetical protein
MVKTNVRPECRPVRHLTAHLGYRLLLLVAIPSVYCLIAAGGRVIEQQNFQKQHTGKHYHLCSVSVSSYFIGIHTNTVIAEPSIIRPAFGRNTHLISSSSHSDNLSLTCILMLSFHLLFSAPNGYYQRHSSTKVCNVFLAALIISTWPAHIYFTFITINYIL